jgi:hypothetical protein
MYKLTQIYKMCINMLRHGKRKKKGKTKKNKLNTEYDAS